MNIRTPPEPRELRRAILRRLRSDLVMQSTHEQRPATPVVIPVTPVKSSSGVTRARPRVAADARWVELVRLAALGVLPGLVVFSLIRPDLAGRVFWTVAIASLPLFFVLAGYHRWRRICPLAFISQVPAMLGRPGQRRAGPWLQAHAYRLAFVIFLVSLWLRLVATNGDGFAIAAFLAAISLAAFATGLIYTGKTWCNYVCPISFVEKLYTEPGGLRETPNSQCQKCTACRPTCPDINQENSYWKEILVPDKRLVFFAFPGVVLAFYVAYFVQAGNWDYYFSGRWTKEVGLVRTAFLPGSDPATAGVFLWPQVPRAIAAVATLLLGAALSLALFTLAQRPIAAFARRHNAEIDEPTVRHMMFSLAAFTAFVAFYSFAGAPTLRLVPGVPHLFQLLVVTTGTLFLVGRIRRSQHDFSEETLARKIIAKWPWSDTPAPRDLQKALLIHRAKSESAEQAQSKVVDMYKNAVRESVNSGVLTRAEVHRLDALRTTFRIADAEHERVMSELVEEERGEAASARDMSPEKQLQLQSYAEALEAYLDQQSASGAPVNDADIRRVRRQYAVTSDEHRTILDRLVREGEGVSTHALDAPATIEEAAAAIRDIGALTSSVARFIGRLLVRRWTRAVDSLLQEVTGGDARSQTFREPLLASDATTRKAAILDLASGLPPATAARLIDSFERASRQFAQSMDPFAALRRQLASPDAYIRATAIYMLESAEQATAADRAIVEKDEHPLVRETLHQARVVAAGATVAEPSVLEKMIALRSISIFDALEPEDLIRLARASSEVWFTRGEFLCREGEIGDELFVLLEGEVSVFRKDGDTDHPVAVHGAGACIGELSVLDSAPREATVMASTIAVRALRLDGRSFREARDASPALAEGIIRLLAHRLRAAAVTPSSAVSPH